MATSEFSLPASSTAPGRARAEVARSLDHDVGPVADDVLLLTSEVVTNAVRHTSSAVLGDVVVRLDVGADRIRVEVLNPGASFDPPAPLTPSITGTGLGLFLVDALAADWAVEAEGPRTKVWFEVPRTPEDRAEGRATARDEGVGDLSRDGPRGTSRASG